MHPKSRRAELVDRRLLAASAKLGRWHVPARALTILAIYASSMALVCRPGFAYAGLLIWPFGGFVLAGFLNAAHDCIHLKHLPSRRGNRIMGVVWCTPILVNFTVYRYQHLRHHHHTGEDGDTEPHVVFPSVSAYVQALAGVAFWRHSISRLAQSWTGTFPVTIDTEQRVRDARWDMYVLTGWLVLVVVLTAQFPRLMVFAYWLPLLFYAPAVQFLSLPEHYGLSANADAEDKVRSVRSNGIVRFFLWNANYHAQHHAFPSIPALNLHNFDMATNGQYGGQMENSYLQFHIKLIRSLRAGQDAPFAKPGPGGRAKPA
jgi:fatty acid desaturase